MCKNGRKTAKNEQKLGRINREAADQLAACIVRNQLWAGSQDTAEWIKTETGQRIAALIEREREERRK